MLHHISKVLLPKLKITCSWNAVWIGSCTLAFVMFLHYKIVWRFLHCLTSAELRLRTKPSPSLHPATGPEDRAQAPPTVLGAPWACEQDCSWLEWTLGHLDLAKPQLSRIAHLHEHLDHQGQQEQGAPNEQHELVGQVPLQRIGSLLPEVGQLMKPLQHSIHQDAKWASVEQPSQFVPKWLVLLVLLDLVLGLVQETQEQVGQRLQLWIQELEGQQHELVLQQVHDLEIQELLWVGHD